MANRVARKTGLADLRDADAGSYTAEQKARYDAAHPLSRLGQAET
jgi:hypothetical protein